MLRGDSHRLYRKLRRSFPNPQRDARLPQLAHVREIRDYYARLAPGERALLLAWAKKEESGIGIIPAALSGVPFLGLVFAPFIQQSIKHVYPGAWVVLWFLGSVAFIAGIYIHHRQKAFTTLHITLLEQLCEDPPPPTAELSPDMPDVGMPTEV